MNFWLPLVHTGILPSHVSAFDPVPTLWDQGCSRVFTSQSSESEILHRRKSWSPFFWSCAGSSWSVPGPTTQTQPPFSVPQSPVSSPFFLAMVLSPSSTTTTRHHCHHQPQLRLNADSQTLGPSIQPRHGPALLPSRISYQAPKQNFLPSTHWSSSILEPGTWFSSQVCSQAQGSVPGKEEEFSKYVLNKIKKKMNEFNH